MQPLNETLLNLWFESSEEQAAYAEHRRGRGMEHVQLRDFSIHQDKVDLLEAVPRPPDVPVMPHKVGLSDKVGHHCTTLPVHAKGLHARGKQQCLPANVPRRDDMSKVSTGPKSAACMQRCG